MSINKHNALVRTWGMALLGLTAIAFLGVTFPDSPMQLSTSAQWFVFGLLSTSASVGLIMVVV